MSRVLVTGGTGFIGRHALPHLLARGYEVHAVGRHPSPDLILAGAEWHGADILDSAATRAVLARVRPTHLLHLAWYAEPPHFWTAPANVEWAAASLDLFRTFRDNGGERAVMAGSCAEYDLSYGYCSEAVTPLRPSTLYGAAKHAVQVTTSAAGATLGTSVAWGRIFFVYGPAEHPNRLVSSVVRSLLQGEPAACSHGRQVRDFLHCEDVAGAFVHLLDSEVQGPVNIASGVPVTVGQVVSAIAALTGRPDLIRLGARPTPPDEPPVILADVHRLSEEVGWRGARELDAGLEQTITWWRDHI